MRKSKTGVSRVPNRIHSHTLHKHTELIKKIQALVCTHRGSYRLLHVTSSHEVGRIHVYTHSNSDILTHEHIEESTVLHTTTQIYIQAFTLTLISH